MLHSSIRIRVNIQITGYLLSKIGCSHPQESKIKPQKFGKKTLTLLFIYIFNLKKGKKKALVIFNIGWTLPLSHDLRVKNSHLCHKINRYLDSRVIIPQSGRVRVCPQLLNGNIRFTCVLAYVNLPNVI